jgi:hypothetical protein
MYVYYTCELHIQLDPTISQGPNVSMLTHLFLSQKTPFLRLLTYLPRFPQPPPRRDKRAHNSQ